MNFDRMVTLYKEKPADFEDMRVSLIEDYINTLPENQQKRARGLQFQIDSTLDRIKNPTERYNRMVSMMWKGFDKLNKALHGEFPTKKNAKIFSIKP